MTTSSTTRVVSEQVCAETEMGGPETYAKVKIELTNGQVQRVRFFYRPQRTQALRDAILISTYSVVQKPTREQIVKRLMELESLFRCAAAALDAYEEVE